MNDQKRFLLAMSVPVCFTLGLAAVFWRVLRGLSAADIVRYLPANVPGAVCVLLLLYGAKGLSMFFPLVVVQLAAGILFPAPMALAVNVAGMAVCMTLPFLVGRFTGPALREAMVRRFPKLARIEAYRCENELMFAYLLRAVGVLPCDVVSWYLGTTETHFLPYLGGSLLGTLTGVIIATLFGGALANGVHWQLFALWGLLTLGSYLCTRLVRARHRQENR